MNECELIIEQLTRLLKAVKSTNKKRGWLRKRAALKENREINRSEFLLDIIARRKKQP